MYGTYENHVVFPDSMSFGGTHFGVGSGVLFLDEVGCTGSESSLLDCYHATSVSCYRNYNAGVRCHGELIPNVVYSTH